MGSRIDAYAHEEAYLSEPYRPWGVSNIKAFYPFSLGTRRLCLKRRLLRRRIIPGYLRTPSPLAGVVPSVVFPSYGYRGGDASRDWLLLLRFHLPPQSFLPVGIGEVTLLTFGLASPATSHAGVTLYAFSWRRLLYWRRLLSWRRLMLTLTLTLTLVLVDAWNPHVIHVAPLVRLTRCAATCSDIFYTPNLLFDGASYPQAFY